MPNANDTTTRRARTGERSGSARPAAVTTTAAAAAALLLLLSLGGGAAACASGTGRTPPAATTTTKARAAGAASAACAAAPYRAFDFWTGGWEVRGPRGRVAGASRVTPALGGCAIEERWRVAAGLGGRSLNAYDRRDGQWHQFWVDVGANVLRLAGGPDAGGAMVLATPRAAGDTATALPPRPPHDRITWTALDGGRVRQQWDTAAAPTAADSSGWRTSFVGVYAPRADSVILTAPPAPPAVATSQPTTTMAAAAPPAAPPSCSAAAGPYRALDFLRGDWEVHLGRADGPVAGRRTVVADLGDCLTVGADFDAAGTYRGISYAAYDARGERWYRESVDDEGRRVVLVGAAPARPGEAVALAELRDGGAAASSAEPLVRVAWRPLADGSGGVAERWERSSDGGATWRTTRDLVLVRR